MKSCIGQKFGRLKILKQWLKQVKTHKQSRVLAQCDCGEFKEFRLSSLRNGQTKSCGCLQKERAKERFATHSMCRTRVYKTWSSMIQRCTNSKDSAYKNYGGRGIKVCERWLKFKNYYKDMGDRPEGLEIDRIDNNKGYFKENCRWTTPRKNGRNTRVSKYWFLYGKKYNSCTEAAESLGVTQSTIKNWCDGYSQISKAGVRYGYPPKDGCYSELKYK